MSSGEAEFYGAVKGASSGLGMRALYGDIGYDLPLRLWTDSSAAVGICSRQGLGKLRHLECTSLWIQQRIRHGELEVRKIAGECNPADLYTKHLESKAKIEQLVSLFGGEFRGGRAASAPQLREDPKVAGMVECLHARQDGDTAGALPDMCVLPHLMPVDEIERMFEKVVLEDDGGAAEAEVRPSVEHGDPGPRGRFEPTPTRFVGAFVIEPEDAVHDVREAGCVRAATPDLVARLGPAASVEELEDPSATHTTSSGVPECRDPMGAEPTAETNFVVKASVRRSAMSVETCNADSEVCSCQWFSSQTSEFQDVRTDAEEKLLLLIRGGGAHREGCDARSQGDESIPTGDQEGDHESEAVLTRCRSGRRHFGQGVRSRGRRSRPRFSFRGIGRCSGHPPQFCSGDSAEDASSVAGVFLGDGILPFSAKKRCRLDRLSLGHPIVMPLREAAKIERLRDACLRTSEFDGEINTFRINHSCGQVVLDGSCNRLDGATRGGVFDTTLIFTHASVCMWSIYSRAISLSPFVAQGFLVIFPLGISVAAL